MNKFQTMIQNPTTSMDGSTHPSFARNSRLEKLPLHDTCTNRVPRSKSIVIKKKARNVTDETRETSLSMKETCDLLTWQMYNRIVEARVSSSRRRRVAPESTIDVVDWSTRIYRKEESKFDLIDSEREMDNTKDENEMIFDLDL